MSGLSLTAPSNIIVGRWQQRGSAALTGVLLGLSRPGPDVGVLAFVGLVPLLLVMRGARPRLAASLGLIAGSVYYGIVVSWAWYFGAIALLPFAMILAAYWAGACACISAVSRRLAHRSRAAVFMGPIATAAVFTIWEGLVSRWPFGGFSWGEIGYAMHDISPLRSLAALGGLPLISFTVVLFNAFLAQGLLASRQVQLRSAGAIAVLTIGVASWFIAWPRMTASGSVHVAMLQGNDINRDLTAQEIADFTLPKRHFALADQLVGRYDLIVFPESGFHPEVVDNPIIVARLQQYARRHSSYVLANGVAEAGDGRAYNRNVLYDRTGMQIGTYDKRHLVPFGEWVPWRSTLQRYIKALDKIPRDFKTGVSNGIFSLGGHKFASVICFESAFGPQVRVSAHNGAELIVVSTNNRSYRRSANSAQHIAIGQIRAAETGRSVLQASVSGASAVIDDRGRVTQHTRMFRNETTSVRAVTRTGNTIYTTWREWVLWASVALLIALFAPTRWLRTAARRSTGDASTLGAVTKELSP